MRVIAGLALCMSLLVSCAQEPGQKSEWTPAFRPSPGHLYHPSGTPLEIQFMTSDVVARVSLDGIEERVTEADAQTYSEWRLASIYPEGDRVYVPVLYYRFEVLEYLRGGSGSDTIWGYVVLANADSESEKEATAAFPHHRERRDKRWDDREAVVFLHSPWERGPRWIDAPEDHYQLGWTDVEWSILPGQDWTLYESYSLQNNGGWFPLASGDSGTLSHSGSAAAQSEERQFILRERSGREVSTTSSATNGGAAAQVETVELSELRRLGALSDEELEAELVEKGNREYLDHLADMNLRASVSRDAVTLRWTRDSYVGQGVVGYRVLRRAQGEQEFVHVADIPPPPRGDPADADLGDVQYEYVDGDGLKPGTTYHYVVRAAVDMLNIDMVDATVEVVTLKE